MVRRQYQRTALESITAPLEDVYHVDFDGGIAFQVQYGPGGCDVGEVENAVCDGQRRLRRKIGRSVLVDCRDERQYRLLDDALHVGGYFSHRYSRFILRESFLARGPQYRRVDGGGPKRSAAKIDLGEGNPSHFLFPHGRTRMMVFPLIRLVGFRAATASSMLAMLPMFVRSRPSRTRWTISPSWPRSDTRTKSIVRPLVGRASIGPAMVT